MRRPGGEVPGEEADHQRHDLQHLVHHLLLLIELLTGHRCGIAMRC